MHRDGALYVLSKDYPKAKVPTAAVMDSSTKNYKKTKTRIVISQKKEPAALIKSLVLSGATSKAVWKKLTNTYHKIYEIQAESKDQTIQLKVNNWLHIQKRLTELNKCLEPYGIEGSSDG